MKLKTFTLSLFYGGIGLFSVSCQQDMPELKPDGPLKAEQVSNLTTEEALLAITTIKPADTGISCSLDALSLPVQELSAGVSPTSCTQTALQKTLSTYLNQFGALENQFFTSYQTVNHVYSLIDNSPQYFGAQGEYTDKVASQKAGLEKFWKMPNIIRLNGLHNNTLNDPDKIAAVYMVYAGYPASIAYQVASQLVAINQLSPIFVETPLLSYDAFASTNNMVILGDGMFQILAESGVTPETAVSGVLAHEWSHQVQYQNFLSWYGVERQNAVKTPELSRQLELEADFFTGYYLTHSLGNRKNWDQAVNFFELFYQMGDCSFTANDHHGTPSQRMAASRLGFIVSALTSKANLDADDVHNIFVASFNYIIEEKKDLKTILATLKNARIRTVFLGILKHELELKGISKGKIGKGQLKHLQD